MSEWIEVPRRVPGQKTKVTPAGTAFGVIKTPNRGVVWAKIMIGPELVQKLGWVEGAALRLRWSSDGLLRLKLDLAPPQHPHSVTLKADKRKTAFLLTTSALPSRLAQATRKVAAVQNEAIVGGGSRVVELILTLPRDCLAEAARER